MSEPVSKRRKATYREQNQYTKAALATLRGKEYLFDQSPEGQRLQKVKESILMFAGILDKYSDNNLQNEPDSL